MGEERDVIQHQISSEIHCLVLVISDLSLIQQVGHNTGERKESPGTGGVAVWAAGQCLEATLIPKENILLSDKMCS